MVTRFSAKISRTIRHLAVTTASCAALAVWTSAAIAQTKGVANYASYLDKSYATAAAATLEQRLASKVLISAVEIDGQTFLRLQSVAMDTIEAKSLVVRATAAGYHAWYQSAESAAHRTVTPSATIPVGPVAPAYPATFAGRSTPIRLTNANPDLAAMLPEGPLLGELYPPRAPRPSKQNASSL